MPLKVVCANTLMTGSEHQTIIQRFRLAHGGASAVEFALILPAFLAIVFGIVVFGAYLATVHGVQQLAAEAGISSIPTLMAFREKVLVFSQPGALNAQQLEQVVEAVKGLDMDEVHAHVARQREEAAASANRPAGPQDGTQIPDA